MHTALDRLWRHPLMKQGIISGVCCGLLGTLTLGGAGCTTTGQAGDGTVVVGEHGADKPMTPEEIDQASGVDQPYYLQVGDVVDVSFALHTLRADEVPWDYKIEVGDSMEVRVSPASTEPGDYMIEAGDVIGISFLDNWQMNVTRTVRTDGMITAPEVGDILARGRTPHELREALKVAYAQSGIIQGEPRVTVNVDFVNLDRYEELSRDIVVRPDGQVRLPALEEDVRIAGLTVQEASETMAEAAAKVLINKPKVSLMIFPAVDTNALADMSGARQVRPDGKITIPRLGEIQAAGYSIDELKYAVAKASEGMIHNPLDPSVDLLKATGGRIYVGGEVNTPGVYPLEGAPSALQAVLMANGFNDRSRLNNVIVVRRNPNGKPYVFKTNIRTALREGHTENDLMLRPFDIVYVPKKTISKLNLYVEQYIEELVPFDNSMGVNAQYYMNEQQIDTKSKSINFNTGATGVLDVLSP